MSERRGIPRSTLLQLTIFLVIGVLCTAYVGVRVFGANPLTGTYRVVVRMADTGGLTPTSEVTYRGVSVGTVEATRVQPGMAGVEIDLRLRDSVRIPAAAKAVVSMESPVAIQKLDLRPADERPPFLHDGSEIGSEATSRPLPLDALLVDFMRVADTIDTHDLQRFSTEVSAGFTGTTGDLRQIVANAEPLLSALEKNEPTLVNLAGNAKTLLETAGGQAGNIRQTTAALRGLTDSLRGQAPAVSTLLESSPPLVEKIVPMLDQAHPAVSMLLANLVSTSQILVGRTPALDELFRVLPDSLHKLASIEHNGVADFYLVAAQGPACYYQTQRRPATEAGARDANTNFACPGDQPNLQQRGAANAPRPGTAPVATYDPTTRQAVAPDGSGFGVGANGGQASVLGPRSWYALLLQGAQGKGAP